MNKVSYIFGINDKEKLNIEFIKVTRAHKDIEIAVKEEKVINLELFSLAQIFPPKRMPSK